MTARHRLLPVVALLAISLSCVPGLGGRLAREDGSQMLPLPLRRLLPKRFPGWRITALSDLLPGDRGLWLKSPDRSGELPGIAVGHFERRDRLSYAVLLLTQRRGKTYNALVLGSQTGRGKWRLRLLSKPDVVANPTVVWRMPPGRYSNWDDTKKVRIVLDGIVNEQIEASAVMYYRYRGRWRQIWLSD